MKKIVIYHHNFVDIGGIETSLINFARSLCDSYDITLITEKIGSDNLKILKKYIKVITELTDDIECDVLIISSINFNKEIIKKIKYVQLYRESHADMKKMNEIWGTKYYLQDLPDAEWVSVSECSQNGLVDEYGIKSILIPNIINPAVEKKKILKLCSATRLTEEKGFKRMKKLCDLFEKYNIPYIWDVYTYKNKRGKVNKPYKNMIFREPKTDICSYYNNYDYIVQLSDSESFCYTMYESLVNGVPVLVTPFPSATDEVKNGKNGYIIPFDMNIDKKLLYKIYSEIPDNVSYKPKVNPVDLWKKLLK